MHICITASVIFIGIINLLCGGYLADTGTYDFDMYFDKLSDVGVNYARLWLTDNLWDDLAVQIGMANFSLPNTW